MKILRVIPSVSPAAGGPVEGLINSSFKLMEIGHEIDVASLDMPDAHWLVGFQLPLYALGKSSRTYGYSPKLREWLDSHVTDYDIVIIQGIWQYHTVAAANACRNHHIPYVVFTHGMLDPWFKKTYPLKHLKKLPYWFLFLRSILHNAGAVIFTTDEERLLARESFPFYLCKETVVNYGIAGYSGAPSMQTEAFYQAFPALKEYAFSLFLSRIHPKKGVDILIKAFASAYPNPSRQFLVIAGPDETGWQNDLQALADQQGVKDRVIFTGLLQGDIKWGAYASAESFVLPSHQENFGIVVAEALSAGLPVLISDKVNIFREVQAEHAGLVSNDTAEDFARLLQHWRSIDNSEKKAMRDNARHCFEQHFEITQAAHSLERVLIDATT